MDTDCVSGKFKCCKCGHGWTPRRGWDNVRCPECHTRRWSEERSKRPHTEYGFSQMTDVGCFMVIPWSIKEDGSMDRNANARVSNALNTYSIRTGRKFRREFLAPSEGIKITRLS